MKMTFARLDGNAPGRVRIHPSDREHHPSPGVKVLKLFCP